MSDIDFSVIFAIFDEVSDDDEATIAAKAIHIFDGMFKLDSSRELAIISLDICKVKPILEANSAQ